MKERYLGKTIKEWTSDLGCSRDRIYAIKKRKKCSLGEAVEMIRSGSGEKKEEYRALSPYYATWFKRFLGLELTPASQVQVESALRAAGGVPFKDIILRAGYSLSAPATMISGYITISTGRPEWGATEGEEYYVLHITGMEDLLTDEWSGTFGVKGEKKDNGCGAKMEVAE